MTKCGVSRGLGFTVCAQDFAGCAIRPDNSQRADRRRRRRFPALSHEPGCASQGVAGAGRRRARSRNLADSSCLGHRLRVHSCSNLRSQQASSVAGRNLQPLHDDVQPVSVEADAAPDGPPPRDRSRLARHRSALEKMVWTGTPNRHESGTLAHMASNRSHVVGATRRDRYGTA